MSSSAIQGQASPDAAGLAEQLATSAKRAAAAMALASTADKDAALMALADLIDSRGAEIQAANALDLAAGETAGLSGALMDRLKLTPARIAAMAAGVRQIAALPDPVGQVGALTRRPNGLQVGRMRIPLGVICIIYESRPNVTIDAGALCLKAGNAPILKGGKEAAHSNGVLVGLTREALAQVGLPADAVQAVATSDREVIAQLIRRDAEVDLVIPRGGEGLIRYITQNATVPVIQHYKGVCHVYVDEGADLAMASAIAFNAKVHRPGVCNAMETLLVHRAVAGELLPSLLARYRDAGVALHGSPRVRALWPQAQAATDADWDAEYLDLELAVRIVDSMDQALAHIARWGSGHTEAIVTSDYRRANAFVAAATSSCVLVNASTRFNDGFELGLGAEIGISTSKLHAYGPMGLEELTTRKFVVYGDGQVRG